MYQTLTAIQAQLREVRATQLEQSDRIGNLESMHAELHKQLANLSVRMDRLTGKVDRIESRLGLIEAQPG
jgi:uncharacterized coiled-coil protein SlyX